VAEGDRFQPIDANMDVRLGGLPARNVEILALGRAGADEHGVVSLVEKRLHARDGGVVTNVDPHVENHGDLFVEHLLR
jgi:hypothetical protein